MNIKLICSLLLCSLALASCIPVVFTGAAATAVMSAKSRTIGQTVDDVKIANAIRAIFLKNHFHELYTKVNVEVSAGRVLYTGKVKDEEAIIEAVKIAWERSGVKEVVNELQVDEQSNRFSAIDFTKDSFITAHIKTKLFANRSIKFINYTIITQNGVVYVFGLARSEEELEKVLSIIAKVKGVERVVEHIKFVEKQGAPEELDSDTASVNEVDIGEFSGSRLYSRTITLGASSILKSSDLDLIDLSRT